MGTKKVQDNAFIKVISKFGVLENAIAPLVVNEADKRQAPIIKWRWKRPDEQIEALIQEAIHEYNYDGTVKWHIKKGEQSWLLGIQALIEELNETPSQNPYVFLSEWSKRNRELAVKAHDDLRNLALFVAKYISDQNGTKR